MLIGSFSLIRFWSWKLLERRGGCGYEEQLFARSLGWIYMIVKVTLFRYASNGVVNFAGKTLIWSSVLVPSLCVCSSLANKNVPNRVRIGTLYSSFGKSVDGDRGRTSSILTSAYMNTEYVMFLNHVTRYCGGTRHVIQNNFKSR